MFVYGIRTRDPVNSPVLSMYTGEDYITVFECRPPVYEAHGYLTPRFWSAVKQLIENPFEITTVDREHPYISIECETVRATMCESEPNQYPDWYYIPLVTRE
jgi:hypothetical protein